MTKLKNPQIKKQAIVIVLLALTIAISYGLPKPKYTSPDIISQLSIPATLPGWQSKDISSQLNLTDDRYNFISRAFARIYANEYGDNLLFLILDAGNFHNPKFCFGGSGFKAKELPDTEFKIKDHTFKAKTIFFEKGKESIVMIYWISINKKIVDWNRQKIIQLWYSLFNKEKAGLMVRLEVPATAATTGRAIKIAQNFLTDATANLPSTQIDYLFGK